MFKDHRLIWLWEGSPHRENAGRHTIWSRAKTQRRRWRADRRTMYMESKRPEQLLASNPGLCLKKKRLKVDWGCLCCWKVWSSGGFYLGGLMKWWCWRETQVFPLSKRAARVLPRLYPAWVRQAGQTHWEQVGEDLDALPGYLLWCEWTQNDILLITVTKKDWQGQLLNVELLFSWL